MPMAFTDEHYAVAIATLAAVEASGDYTAISALDTLSLGIGQWTQGRAFDLLKRFPSGTSFGSTVDGWLAQARSTWTIEARKVQYLSAVDRSALKAALGSATGRQIQDSQMVADIRDSYLPTCRQWGLDPDAYPDAAILLMVVMHRWGEGASILGRIVRGAGSAPTIDSMIASIRYSGEYSMVPSRYATAERYVRNHITNGVTVNGSGNSNTGDAINAGEDNGHTTGDDASDDYAGTVKYIRDNGDGSLQIIFEDDSTARALPTSVGYWQASPDTQVSGKGSTPEVDSGTDTPSETGTTDERMARMIARLKADCQSKPYRYQQAYEARLRPETSGVSDCSGYVWYLYNKFYGIDIGKGGTSEIISNNVGKVIATGSGTFNAQSKVRAGDLIVCLWTFGGGHVEMFTGDGEDCASMRGGSWVPGPNGPSPASGVFNASCKIWKVKRYV